MCDKIIETVMEIIRELAEQWQELTEKGDKKTRAELAKNIQKEFGDNLVLSDLDLEVEERGIFGIIGLNGSGKTTLLRVLVGFYRPEEGHVFFKGRDIKKQDIKRSFGFATQDNCFYDNLTVEENLKYFGGLYGLTKEFLEKNIKEVLELVELYDARGTLAGNLSTGMQRRLDIACAIIHKPEVLILDEPTEDLDPKLRIRMLQ